ncbi:hypothetical protein BaRGS_00021269 [Batillaria attramentaria]|uniref:Uncharacterized protein n=1 Tax=Batillaria attramentaria TaxID=370345 RepID=A0ABD0KK87_9CAEN
MLSLVQASDTSLPQLRTALLNLIGWYQDCVMACEHQFSKRDSSSLAESSDDWENLCELKQCFACTCRSKPEVQPTRRQLALDPLPGLWTLTDYPNNRWCHVIILS